MEALGQAPRACGAAPSFPRKRKEGRESGEPSLHPHSFYGQKLRPVTWPPGHQPSGGGAVEMVPKEDPSSGGEHLPSLSVRGPMSAVPTLPAAPCGQGEGPGSPTSPEAPLWSFALWPAQQPLPSLRGRLFQGPSSRTTPYYLG